MFRYVGRSKMGERDDATKQTEAVLWQDNTGGGQTRHFFVRPSEAKRYHLRIIVGNVVTTNRENVGKREVVSAARLMGIEIGDGQWHEVDKLLQRA